MSSTTRTTPLAACFPFLAAAAIALSCGEQPPPAATPPPAGGSTGNPATHVAPDPNLRARIPTPTPRKQLRNAVAEAIGAQLIWCTPDAAPDDTAARDTAANALLHLGVLTDATDDTIIWGVIRVEDSMNPDTSRGLLLDPGVWAGCYLSCFVFYGAPALDQVGDSIILKVPAKFRASLPAGDYPHPLWHPGNEWESYAKTTAVELVFTDNRLIAAFRLEDSGAQATEAPREWDGLWRWKEGVYIKPRIADFVALFSHDNPYVDPLDRAFEDLVPVFAANNCLACHTPDNPAGARSLLVLALPVHAMAARASLAAIMTGESDGPDAATRCTVASLKRLPNADAITDAAIRFLEEGDGTTEYEWIRLIRQGEDAPRISP